jgi:uncharacterized protein with HEPN domain
VLLLQTRDAVDNLDRVMSGVTRKTLDDDLTVRLAVGYVLLMISDLLGKIYTQSPEFVSAHPEIPWTEVRGFRNRLAHDYFNLDLDIVWAAATESVPAMMKALRPSIPPEPHSGS